MSEPFERYDTLERYETVLKNIRDGVYTLDANGLITWVNETAIEEFNIGYDREDLIGAPVSIVLNEDDIEKCLEIIQDCLQSDDRNSGRCEIDLQTGYGNEIPCDLHLALLTSKEGEFQGTVGVVRDITDRKRREQQLEVQNRVLRHNLRNTMNVVLGLVEELETEVDDKAHQEVQTIREVGEELLDLSEKVQSLSKIRKWIETEREVTNLIALIESILIDYQKSYPDVEFDFDKTAIEDVQSVAGNEELLDLALRNLIDNAIQHNDANQPRVSVVVDSRSASILVRIKDNGQGLPENEKRVLKSGSETALLHSSGLGLWLVYWCITGIEGNIRFEEATPNGTTVTLEIPTALTT